MTSRVRTVNTRRGLASPTAISAVESAKNEVEVETPVVSELSQSSISGETYRTQSSQDIPQEEIIEESFQRRTTNSFGETFEEEIYEESFLDETPQEDLSEHLLEDAETASLGETLRSIGLTPVERITAGGKDLISAVLPNGAAILVDVTTVDQIPDAEFTYQVGNGTQSSRFVTDIVNDTVPQGSACQFGCTVGDNMIVTDATGNKLLTITNPGASESYGRFAGNPLPLPIVDYDSLVQNPQGTMYQAAVESSNIEKLSYERAMKRLSILANNAHVLQQNILRLQKMIGGTFGDVGNNISKRCKLRDCAKTRQGSQVHFEKLTLLHYEFARLVGHVYNTTPIQECLAASNDQIVAIHRDLLNEIKAFKQHNALPRT